MRGRRATNHTLSRSVLLAAALLAGTVLLAPLAMSAEKRWVVERQRDLMHGSEIAGAGIRAREAQDPGGDTMRPGPSVICGPWAATKVRYPRYIARTCARWRMGQSTPA
ncbi:hypothetical protein J2T57_001527 [Natronocella acetinitrilica]|uniref:Uncharacterized protein n=1 Tax=Natronocella acetinitrilica TaxID=414046 RepID=A0AAE3G252_9GAMM|nr:hypothetical protein [Natronocella acetinitrilica]MCP1674425.1 hypothetical protein [Natronocella acetinitrilica]